MKRFTSRSFSWAQAQQIAGHIRNMDGLEQGGMHAFRRGCNPRWELAGIKPVVIRQQMGHSSDRMTALYSGEIPLDQVQAAFSGRLLEKVENEAAA